MDVTPFTVKSVSQFRAAPPPNLKSSRYAKAYDEVKTLGPLLGSTRTAEQTDVAYFFADNYLNLWNRVIREIATNRVTDIADSARLFALAVWRLPMLSSPAGTASTTMFSGDRSQLFRRELTGNDKTWATRTGSL